MAIARKNGMYFIPPFISPFCIIDIIIAEQTDITERASTENILKSSLSSGISLNLKGNADWV